MAIDRVPVLKRCRALGLEPVHMGYSKSSKKKPSMQRKKISEYGLQLREKQKVKFLYGVLEKQFRNYFEKAAKKKGIVGENLMALLELRLDNVVYRLGFARTRMEARQIVSHNLITVNGKKVNIASYQVKMGDVIEVKEKAKELQRFKDVLDATSGRRVVNWLSCEPDNLRGTVASIPTRDQIDSPINETLIVELYSK